MNGAEGSTMRLLVFLQSLIMDIIVGFCSILVPERVADLDWAATVTQGITQLYEPQIDLSDDLKTLHQEHVDDVKHLNPKTLIVEKCLLDGLRGKVEQNHGHDAQRDCGEDKGSRVLSQDAQRVQGWMGRP